MDFKNHGGEVFGLVDRDRYLDFSININPLGLSPEGRKELERFWERETLRYPDVECRGLIRALSERYLVPEPNITVGNGATELMYTLVRIIRPACVFVPQPSFSEYKLSAMAADVPVEGFLLKEETGFAIDFSDLISRLKPDSLIYLGHPNNPDGRLLSNKDFEEIAAACVKTKSLLVIDESFIDFLDDSLSYRHECIARPEVLVMTSLTKFYAVPGLRIGCCFASEELTQALRSALVPWHINGPAQLYMTKAVEDESYIKTTREFVQRERKRFSENLALFDEIKVYPGAVNFILCRLEDKFPTSAELQGALKPYYILIRRCGNYEGLDDRYFRVAVRTEDENDRFLAALKEVLA